MSSEQQTDEQQRNAAASPANDDAAAASSAADSSSKPSAGGASKKKKGGKKEEVAEVDPNYPGQRFRIGELIYANYADGAQWFEAKVLKVDRRNGLIYYYLHYQGWSDKFNDWRPYHLDSELMKHDENGRRIFEEAKQKLKESKAGGKGGKNNAAAAEGEMHNKADKSGRRAALFCLTPV